MSEKSCDKSDGSRVESETPEVLADPETVQSFQRVMTLKKKHGKCGSYRYDDGSFYIGDFDENGVRCGVGHLEMPNGSTYDGHFLKGLPNTVGVMRFSDSSRFEGEFMQGWFHGLGVYHTIDGMKFEGEFRGGRIWGNGLLTFKDGITTTEGYFQDSRFSRKGNAMNEVVKARKIATYARQIFDQADYECFKTTKEELSE